MKSLKLFILFAVTLTATACEPNEVDLGEINKMNLFPNAGYYNGELTYSNDTTSTILNTYIEMHYRDVEKSYSLIITTETVDEAWCIRIDDIEGLFENSKITLEDTVTLSIEDITANNNGKTEGVASLNAEITDQLIRVDIIFEDESHRIVGDAGKIDIALE